MLPTSLTSLKFDCWRVWRALSIRVEGTKVGARRAPRLLVGLYSLKNCNNPFGKGFQPSSQHVKMLIVGLWDSLSLHKDWFNLAVQYDDDKIVMNPLSASNKQMNNCIDVTGHFHDREDKKLASSGSRSGWQVQEWEPSECKEWNVHQNIGWPTYVSWVNIGRVTNSSQGCDR